MVQHAYMRAARARALKRYKSAIRVFEFSPAERGRHGPYARGRGAWAATYVAVAFQIAWPPLWVDTEPALPRYTRTRVCWRAGRLIASLTDSHRVRVLLPELYIAMVRRGHLRVRREIALLELPP